MPEMAALVHVLTEVGFAGSTRVELSGELVAEEGSNTALGGHCIARRTDVGFVVLERVGEDASKKASVFHRVETQISAAPGLALLVDTSRIELNAADLQLEELASSSLPCDAPPPGFESVMESRHATRGRLTRRDQRLMSGDRVEFVGTIERTKGGSFRNVGPYLLHDLSTGALRRR